MSVKNSMFFQIKNEAMEQMFEFTLQMQKGITNDYIQDIQSFDFGFQPNTILMSNFKHVFYYSDSNVKLLHSQKLSNEDNSFQKIHQVKRLDGELYCILDEDCLMVMNLHSPLKSIKHFQQEKALFLDIVVNQISNPFSFADFENLDSLNLEPEQ